MISINELKRFISDSGNPLFKKNPEKSLTAIFDKEGFWFDSRTENIYNQIKGKPHIYVAFTNNQNGYYYIGISNQNGGRWKRTHAYHLGTLAYHLLDTIRYDDQNHKHWIDSWMDENTFQLNENINSIQLKEEVLIAFLPFELYSDINYQTLNKSQIKRVNLDVEAQLINSLKEDGKILLNKQNNKYPKTKPTLSKTKNKNSEVAISDIGKNCIEFNVLQNQNIHEQINLRNDLPRGKCSILLFNSTKPSQLVYASNRNKGKRKTGGKGDQNIYDFFGNTDMRNNIPQYKWNIVQAEMKEKKIKEITVRVCVSIDNTNGNNNSSPIKELKPKKPSPKKLNTQVIVPNLKSKSQKHCFLVPCSSAKSPELINYYAEEHGIISFDKELGSFRSELMVKLEECDKHEGTRKNKKVKIKKQKIDMAKRLPAYKLYSLGKLFTAADSNKWTKGQAEKVYIISALFGIIKATDYLPMYDLAIRDQLYLRSKKESPFKFWKGKLDSIIEKLINEGNVIYDLLSDNYREVIPNSADKLKSTGEKWKYDRGSKRGKWLKKNL